MRKRKSESQESLCLYEPVRARESERKCRERRERERKKTERGRVKRRKGALLNNSKKASSWAEADMKCEHHREVSASVSASHAPALARLH